MIKLVFVDYFRYSKKHVASFIFIFPLLFIYETKKPIKKTMPKLYNPNTPNDSKIFFNKKSAPFLIITISSFDKNKIPAS